MYYYNNNGKLQTSPIPLKHRNSVFLTPDEAKSCIGFDNEGIPILNDENLKKSTLKKKIDEINENVKNKIINDFYSNVTGSIIHYQTSLTDQFEISQIRLANIDFKIKVYDNEGNSKRVFHTASQIAQLYDEFFNFLALTKLSGDNKKENLINNYKSMSLQDLQNYDTSI